jgi:hypothetical protein
MQIPAKTAATTSRLPRQLPGFRSLSLATVADYQLGLRCGDLRLRMRRLVDLSQPAVLGLRTGTTHAPR